MKNGATASDPGAIRAVAALSDDLRRRLYEFIRAARGPVSRDEAASAAGISRKLAAFHLDKLVEVNLLRFGFQNPNLTRGRPPKVYVPSDLGIEVSIPARRHQLLAEVLARAVVTESEHGSVSDAAARAARDRGVAAATRLPEAARGGRIGTERALTRAEQVLADHGFEPYRSASGCIRLRNCPFHPLAAEMPELVCRLNHAFAEGVLDGLKADAARAVLAPRAGECCVELRAQNSLG